MITLRTEFTKNANLTGKQTFTQLKKEGTNYIYARTREDGSVFGYEVFCAHVIKKGTACFQKVYEDDEEQYPGAAVFGKSAWFCETMEMAEKRFNGLVSGQIEVVQEVEVADSEEAVLVPVAQVSVSSGEWLIPEGEFTTAQFGATNNLPVPGKGYFELRSLLSAGKVEETERRKVGDGRGRPTVFFKKVLTA